MDRRFGWLWAAYSVSTFGTWIAFDAFPLVAILALDAGPAQVAVLAASGRAVGALAAVPLGPWVEFRRKRPVMIGTDLVRCAALLSIPLAYAFGALTFAQLLVVSVVVAAAEIAFRAASGAFLRGLVPAEELLTANARFEQTTWTATALGPPLGGAAIGLLGLVVTMVADGASYLLSALGLRAIGDSEPPPAERASRMRAADLFEGWRTILASPVLRPLFLNTVLVSALILATMPPVAVLMLGPLGFTPLEYGLAFGLPCVGGLVGARLSRPIAERLGRDRVLRVFGTLRACWSIGLVFVAPGLGGLALVLVVQLGLVTCMGVFTPVFATERLERIPADRLARTLAAWAITNGLTIAAVTALWGVLAAVTSPRIAIGAAGVLLLATPLLLPRRA